jgi:hypothetical protein
MRVLLTVVMASVALVACGAPDAPRAPSSSEAPPVASSGAPCNAVAQEAEVVDLVGSAAPAPTATGGTIEDGTYVLVGLTLHTPGGKEDGAKLATLGKTTMEIKGGTTQLVRTSRDGVEVRTTVTRANAGTNTTATTTCVTPPAKPDATTTAQYTASPTSLLLINPGPAGTSVATYRKVR